jgi:hypothetical protein
MQPSSGAILVLGPNNKLRRRHTVHARARLLRYWHTAEIAPRVMLRASLSNVDPDASSSRRNSHAAHDLVIQAIRRDSCCTAVRNLMVLMLPRRYEPQPGHGHRGKGPVLDRWRCGERLCHRHADTVQCVLHSNLRRRSIIACLCLCLCLRRVDHHLALGEPNQNSVCEPPPPPGES